MVCNIVWSSIRLIILFHFSNQFCPEWPFQNSIFKHPVFDSPIFLVFAYYFHTMSVILCKSKKNMSLHVFFQVYEQVFLTILLTYHWVHRYLEVWFLRVHNSLTSKKYSSLFFIIFLSLVSVLYDISMTTLVFKKMFFEWLSSNLWYWFYVGSTYICFLIR